MVGKRGRCPHCSTIFSIPDPHTAIAPTTMPLRVPAAPDVNRGGAGWREIDVSDDPPRGAASRQSRRDDDYDDYDAPYDREPRSLAHLAPGWSTVASGISLMRTAMIIFIIVALVMVLFFILSLAARGNLMRNRQAEMLLVIFTLMGGLTGLVAIILFVVGQCMCCAAPPESGTKGQAVGSVICLFVGIGLGLVGFLFLIVAAERVGRMRGEGVAIMAGLLWLLTTVLAIVSHALFVLFLRNVGRYFRNQQLSSGASTYLLMMGIFSGFLLLLVFLSIIMSSAGRPPDQAALSVLLVILAIGLTIFELVLFLYFLDLLARTRTTIYRATEARG